VCNLTGWHAGLGWTRVQRSRKGPAAIYRLTGSTLYLFGTILVTQFFNVPLNNALAAVEPDSAEGAVRWAEFAGGWTVWNHVSRDSTMAENKWSIVSASDVNCEWDYVANGLAGPCRRAWPPPITMRNVTMVSNRPKRRSPYSPRPTLLRD
jgi:hypothetical protein